MNTRSNKRRILQLLHNHFPRPGASRQLRGMFAGKASKPISIVAMNKAIGIAAASGGQRDQAPTYQIDDLDALPGIPPG